MEFDQNNKVIQLCAAGMELEGQGQPARAGEMYAQAWQIAESDFEKFTAAHYVARQQPSLPNKLEWDQLALHHALKIPDEGIRASLPSLYLNIGKCYEDLHDMPAAKEQYELALSFTHFLAEDGYGRMVKKGIENALERVH